MKKLLTKFAEKMDKTCPLSEYPRPQLRRDSYLCLNGEWDYAIVPQSQKLDKYQGKILVPFSPECILSGVEKQVTPQDILYYKRDFVIEKEFIKERTLLHFGAVDYSCEVSVNNQYAGENKGGYYPFTIDITKHIKIGKNQITLKVSDPTDTGNQARGKQTFNRGGIWYTPQSGIWQTVWLESVHDNYIKNIKLTPDIDNDLLNIEINYNKDIIDAQVTVLDKGKEFLKTQIKGGKGEIKLKDYELWTPENPYLYDLIIQVGEDKIQSYFGMRKFGIDKDKEGVARLTLNNKPYFHNGILDQGYWSDGMYTAPSDEALIYDIALMKEMGFNMLRKHIKIEPLRWYYHCDRLGIIVWQDMINGGGKYSMMTIGIRPFMGNMMDDSKYKSFSRENKEGREEFYEDSKRMIENLYNTVSIAVWVPFNEGWGQFDSKKAYDFYKELDPTRTIDHASGWHDQGIGDMKSRHIYFTPIKMKIDYRPFVLSEFGGYSLKTQGHMFNDKKFFGYKKYYNQSKFQQAFINLYEKKIIPLIPKGLCATVYTELSDVEDECNGIVTYDRKIVKLDKKLIKSLNEKLKL